MKTPAWAKWVVFFSQRHSCPFPSGRYRKGSDKLKLESNYILGLSSSLNVAIDALNKDYTGFNGRQILSALGKFNIACTGNNFPSRELEPGQPAPLAEILKAAENLKCEILRARKNNYRWRDAVSKSQDRAAR